MAWEGFEPFEPILSSTGKWLAERLQDADPNHQNLFGSHQVSVAGSSPTVESAAPGGGSAPQGTEEIMLASRGFSPALSPDQWPGDAAENPREYLEYLLDKAERDQQALEDWYAEVLKRQPVVWTEDGPVAADAGAEKAVQDLIELKHDIESARSGIFPPSKEKMAELYGRLMSIRDGGRA